MKKETVVEWLQWSLVNTILTHEQVMQTIGLFEQAKDMFEEQVKDAYKFGLSDEYVIGSERYYQETFKSE